MVRVAEARIDEIFVIGGDLAEPHGPYPSALSLLRAMAETGRTLPAIGVGAYPERHPLIEDEDLLRALLDKQAFATSMVTQICFDSATIVRWLTAVRARGITLPAHVGMPGVLKRRKLLEISLRVGVGDSVRYLTRHGSIVARLMRRAGYRPDALVATLAPFVDDPALGIEGFHINTFNQVEGTERWRRQALGIYGGRLEAGLRRPIGELGRDEDGSERGSAS